jgi:hypothetical protein
MMHDKLTLQEFKAICQLFFQMGQKEIDFEVVFDSVLEGKYNDLVAHTSVGITIEELNQQIEKCREWEKWNMEEKIRHAKAIRGLADLIITV